MNKNYLLLTLFVVTFLGLGLVAAEARVTGTISEERYNKICRWGILNPPECKKRIIRTRSAPKQPTSSNESDSNQTTQKENYDSDCKWGMFNPPKCRGKDSRVKDNLEYKPYKKEKEKKEAKFFKEENNNISVYAGRFDINDEVGDDKTSLMGIEHKNKDLFRNTWLGKFSPTTGALVTGKSAIYLYSGVEADYNLGPINISPSFAPGYYEAGNGKNLGSALEFKSEIKIGFDLFENSNLGYSFSHISNNDWGDVNPGTDNQSISFSKKF